MVPPSSDQSQAPRAFAPLRLDDPLADIGRAERRPTWWLDQDEHARLLGTKPPTAKATKAPKPRVVVKPRPEPPPLPEPEKAEAPPVADFATLVPTLTSLDRILQPLAPDVPGVPHLLGRRIKRIGRFGATFGVAALVAAAVFFR
jgi:hypothetical protein